MDWWEIGLGVFLVVGGIAALVGELRLYDWAFWRREPKADRRNWPPPG
jgi:hypothetical protein